MTTSNVIQTETEEKSTGSPQPATTKLRAVAIFIAALVIVVDHFSKLFVEVYLPLNHTWAPYPEVMHLFRITHVSNTGAAFGLFPGGSLFFTLVAVAVAIMIVVYNFGLPPGNALLRVALGLQVGGALGNLVDRLRLGHVTDFLDFGPWPVFNLADTAIVGGVAILGILMLLEQRQFVAQEESFGEETGGAPGSMSRLSTQRHNEQAT